MIKRFIICDVCKKEQEVDPLSEYYIIPNWISIDIGQRIVDLCPECKAKENIK